MTVSGILLEGYDLSAICRKRKVEERNQKLTPQLARERVRCRAIIYRIYGIWSTAKAKATVRGTAPLRATAPQGEGVAKWKLRRRYCLLSHREDPALGPQEHTFAYIVGPWSHSPVASSHP